MNDVDVEELLRIVDFEYENMEEDRKLVVQSLQKQQVVNEVIEMLFR
jgi:hypothetical protein